MADAVWGATPSLLLQAPIKGPALSCPVEEKAAGWWPSPGHHRPALGTQNLPLLRKGRVWAKTAVVILFILFCFVLRNFVTL